MSASTRVCAGGRGRDQEFPLHAGELMSRHAAVIKIIAGFGCDERDAGARAPADNPRRFRGRPLIGEDDVVFGPFAVDQRDLDDLAFGGRQRVGLPSIVPPTPI